MSTPAFLRGMLEHERGLFCNVVGAVPEDGREHRADPKARSATELIGHLIGHNQDMIELLDDGVINHRMQVPFETVEDAARARLKKASIVSISLSFASWAVPFEDSTPSTWYPRSLKCWSCVPSLDPISSTDFSGVFRKKRVSTSSATL